ncbi:hypothetical protein ACFY5H_33520 [Streptomyces sp. NPDC013012]|uniref:hypothetical protein n=1 Tax=Streptomyces sp. NPDC013012 TaxID=3364860 RepID=UPI0036C2E2EE
MPVLNDLLLDDPKVYAAVSDLVHRDWIAFERKVGDFQRAGGSMLATLLSALSGIAAVLDPNGTLPTLMLNGVEAAPWSPRPRQVAE